MRTYEKRGGSQKRSANSEGLQRTSAKDKRLAEQRADHCRSALIVSKISYVTGSLGS